ncbi:MULTISPECIES: TIGR00730 family Rossman fold protein [Anaeromyxobacter]|uniref:LOG family protein n=1 Tax=Anaeromyxobacter TaxID=161492 RepID=UPI001F587CF8|nr:MULTISPECIES: TIGR00730 family Rossman fold protein [unclassified Anaeromyxobacter]
MKRICVFCGSSPGINGSYVAMAQEVGRALARRGLGLVYGGGSVGLMGAVASAALEAGGEVDGVIPRALLARELGHGGLTRQHVVGSMHERKAKMAELSDAFLALPGGMGTLEELSEILTWAQLGLHAKPCGLLDVAGYYRPLISYFDHAVTEGFLRSEHRRLILVGEEPGALLDAFDRFEPPRVQRWIDPETA